MVTGGEPRRGPGPLLRADGADRRRPLDALHDRGDVRADAAGDARRATPSEAVALANEGPYGLQASVWTRDDVRGEEIARRIEAGSVVRQRRAAQLRGARAADGRLEGVRPRLAPRARRDPQVHAAPVAHGHPRLRAVARRPPLPVQRRGEPGDGGGVRGAGDQRPLLRRPAGDPDRALRHLHPVARRRPTARTDQHGFWARAASHAAIPEGVEVALLQAELPDEQVDGPARAARLARRERDGGGDAAGAARADRPSASATRARRRSPGSRTLRNIAAHALLRAPRSRHRPQPELGRDRLPGPDVAAARSPAPARDAPPRRAPRR